MKISGLCGRLKCCLNYELDAYMDALEDFPTVEVLETRKGKAFLQKTDIFKGKMWFSYPDETTWYPMNVSEVKRIVKMNENGKKPEALAALKAAESVSEKVLDFVDVVGTDLPPKEQRSNRRGKNNRGKSNHQRRNKSNNRNRNNNNKSNNRNRNNKSNNKPNNKSNNNRNNKPGGKS